jgi:hypothetical protein
MKTILTFTSVAAAASLALGAPFVSQQPVSGGGVSRWSQLWQDPGPNGNDLDGDSVCWEDFTINAPTTIRHMEWWGVGACELGFQIEFWKQDPGTIAYQPLGVFYYGGDHTVRPEAKFRTTAYTTHPGPGGITQFVLDLPTPVTLPANTASNPRWFVAIIGLTHQAYYTWNWSQGTGGSNRTYQFIRGSGSQFRSLPEGRALVLSTGCDADFNADGTVDFFDYLDFASAFDADAPAADFNHNQVVDFFDYLDFVAAFDVGC